MSQKLRSSNSNDSFDFIEIYHPATKMAPGSVKATEPESNEPTLTQTAEASGTASILAVTPPTRATVVESLTQPDHSNLLPVPVPDNGKLTATDQKLPEKLLLYAEDLRRANTVFGNEMLDQSVISEKERADAGPHGGIRSDMREMWHSSALLHEAPSVSTANPKPVTSMAEALPSVQLAAAKAYRQPLAFRPWSSSGVDNHTYYPDNAFPPTYHYQSSGFYDSPVCASPDLTVYPPDDVEDIDHFHAFVMSREPTPPPVQAVPSQGVRQLKPKQSANQILREYRQQQASYRSLKEYGEKIEREQKEKTETKAALFEAKQEIAKMEGTISRQQDALADSQVTVEHLLAEVDHLKNEAVTAAASRSTANQRDTSKETIDTYRRCYYQAKASNALKAIRQNIGDLIKDFGDSEPLSDEMLGELIAEIESIANEVFEASDLLDVAKRKEGN